MLGHKEGAARPKALHWLFASSPTSSCVNSFGVMYPRDRCGRTWLYFHLQSPIITRSSVRVHIKRLHAYRPIPHLDPAIRARLVSALQRPDLKLTTRAKIEAVLQQ